MSIDTAGYGTFIIVLIMAVVTLITRLGGVFVMSFVPINYRVQQFISDAAAQETAAGDCRRGDRGCAVQASVKGCGC